MSVFKCVEKKLAMLLCSESKKIFRFIRVSLELKVSSKCSLLNELPMLRLAQTFRLCRREKGKRTIFPCCVLASEPTLTFECNLEVYFGKSRLLFWVSPFETNSRFFTVNLVHVCPKTPDGSPRSQTSSSCESEKVLKSHLCVFLFWRWGWRC